MSESLQTRVDKPYGQQDETRAAAIRVVSLEPDAALLLEVLGLTSDPVAEAKTRAKAAAALTGKNIPKPRCPLCNNPLPSHGVCRRAQRCRAAARARGEHA